MDRLCKDYKLSHNDYAALVLIKHSLYRIVVEGADKPHGVYQFFNRLSVLFQEPTVFVVYKENENGVCDLLLPLFHTYTDPENKDKYDRAMEEHVRKGDWNVDDLTRLYDTHYYLLPLRVKRTGVRYNGVLVDSNLEFGLYGKDKDIYKIFQALFHKPESEQDPVSEFLSVKTHIQKQLNKIAEKYDEKSDKEQSPILYKYKYIDLDLAFVDVNDMLFKHVENFILEPVYQKYLGSPLLSRLDDVLQPENICYFVRTYDSDDDIRRYKGRYDYNIRMLIPPSQEEEFKRVFENIQTSLITKKSNDKHWLFGTKTLHVFQNERMQALFVDTLKKKGGINKVLKILRTPYGRHARAFVDTVFQSGFCDIRRDSLKSGLGLDRIEKEHLDKKDVEVDKIRIVALYYLFSAMASEFANQTKKNGEIQGQKHISCNIRPLRVGYSPWLAFVTFSDFDSGKRTNNQENFLNWSRYYHFYHDVTIPQGQKIRVNAKRSYFHIIALIVSETMKFRYFQAGQGKKLQNEKVRLNID
jgi:hypothetical protein